MSLVVRVCLGGNDIQTAKVGSCSVDRFPYDLHRRSCIVVPTASCRSCMVGKRGSLAGGLSRDDAGPIGKVRRVAVWARPSCPVP